MFCPWRRGKLFGEGKLMATSTIKQQPPYLSFWKLEFFTFFNIPYRSWEEDGHQPEGPELADEQVDEAMSWHDKGEHVRKMPHLGGQVVKMLVVTWQLVVIIVIVTTMVTLLKTSPCTTMCRAGQSRRKHTDFAQKHNRGPSWKLFEEKQRQKTQRLEVVFEEHKDKSTTQSCPKANRKT